MTRRHHGYGYALLAAICALIVAVSAAIYVGVGFDDGTPPKETFAGGRSTPRNPAAPASTGTWVGAWSASPAGGEPGTEANGLAGRSVRNVVHTSVGGTSARVTLSNLYGRQPLTITHASLAVAAAAHHPAAVDRHHAPPHLRRQPDGRHPAPGQQIVSDAVRVTVPPTATCW